MDLRDRSLHGGCDEIPLPGGPGRLWLCGKRVVGPAPEEALAAVGASRIVCLCEFGELQARYPEYVAWLRRQPKTPAIWFPIPDLHAPRLDAAVPFLSLLGTHLAAGDGLIMHCGAGHGRAGTMAVALLMTMGAERAAALSTVADSRPLAGPQGSPQADFLAALEAR